MAVFDAVWDTLAKLRAEDSPLPPPVADPRSRGDLPRVELEPLTPANRAAVVRLVPRPQQHLFGQPSVAHLLAVTGSRGDHKSLVVVNEGTVVGHILVRESDDACWVESFLVDGGHQGRGIGTSAAKALRERFDHHEIRAVLSADNHPGHRFAEHAGLHPSDQVRPEGVVWVRLPHGAPPPTRDAGH